MVLTGEIDVGSVQLLAEACAGLTASCLIGPDSTPTAELTAGRAANAPTAVVDAAGLVFIDAAGLGVLVALHRSLAAAGIRLRTVRPAAQFRWVSAICRLDQILGLEPAEPGGSDQHRLAGVSGGAPVVDMRRWQRRESTAARRQAQE